MNNMGKRRSSKQGPVNSRKIKYDGINFNSGLERYCYMALKKAGIYEGYENEKFTIIEGFSFENASYEYDKRTTQGFVNKGTKKVLGITYTPDFCGKDFIIECKGRPNESFPLRWKLFKRWVYLNKDSRTLYKPQNQKQIDRMIQLILENRRRKVA